MQVQWRFQKPYCLTLRHKSSNKKKPPTVINAQNKRLNEGLIQKTPFQGKQVNPLLVLERKIIGILLQYGNQEADFDDLYVSYDEEGNNYLKSPKIVHSKVHEKIFLDLQQDEVELIQPEFSNFIQTAD